MIDIKKIISILLVLCTLLSAIPYSAFALSWDGSSAGGSTNAVNGSSTGYVIRSTSDSACVVGYRFSAVNSSGGMKVTKVIDVYRNTSNGDNAYSTSAKFSTKYNKKQIIANKNAKLTTTYNQTNCYEESSMGFTTTLPNPSGVETWQSYEANINKVLSKLGVGSVSNMVYGDKVIIEPLFDVCLAGEYQALTVSEMAYCGRSVLGGSSTGGTSDGTSKTWGFIANYTNRIWPNKLYTPDGQGLWTAASTIGSSSKETFDNIITKGFGAGIAYNETTNKTYTIKFNGNGSTSGSMSNLAMTYGVAKNLTANAFSKTGNVFAGWNTKVDGSGTSYSNKQSVKNLTSTQGATVNLYAQWYPYILTVNYHANGGSTSSTMFKLVDGYVYWKSLDMKVSQTVEYNNTVGIFNASNYDLYKTGYTTSSWTTKADGETEVTYDSTKKTSDFASNITTGDRSITLYAKWVPNTYTIKFNGNGNTGGSTANMSMTYDVAKSLTANGFTKTGYVFDGWDTKADGSGTDYSNQQSVKNLTTTNGATSTLYAKWKPITYTISFNGNGSTSGSTSSMSMTYDVAKILTANGFAKTGYTFAGWNTKANGLGTSYSNKQSVKNLITTNGGTVTLYAQWTPITYTIKFNGNGSTSGSTASMSMNYDVSKALTANGFVRTGYVFDGWDTKSDGSGTDYSNQQSVKNLTTTNGDTITLYAKWKPITYTISFNGNGSTSGSTASMSMTYDVAKNLTANGFAKTGYTFAGWNTKANGSGTSYTNKQSVKNLTTTNGGTVTLYAQWTPITYTIQFNGNGSTSGSTASMSITYDVAKNLTANGFAKTGYHFSGWNTKADGSGTSYYNQQSVKNLTTINGATITLYAQWSTNSYTIAFDGNGNTGGTTSSMTMKFDETKNLTANGYTKTGHTFSKWTTKGDGSGTSYTNKQSVKNLTSTNGATVYLYAQWTPNTYTIKFDGNGATSGSTASMSMTYGVAKNLTANGFVRTGHYFNGWNTKADGTGTSYSNKQSVKNLTSTNGATVTLYAQWVPYELKVYYNANGGSINSDTYSLSSNDIYVKSSGSKYYQEWVYNKANSSGLVNASTFDIYKTGYTFNKWGTSSSGGTLFDQNDTTITPTMLNSGIASGNVTLKVYAQWTPNTYTIKFYGNTHTGGSTASMSMTYDVAKNLAANGFTKTGYTFVGWNTSADGTGTNYSDKQSVKNLTATNGATINLYAQWVPNELKVYYNANGGSINSDTYSLSSNDIYVKSSGSKYYQTWTYNKANSSGLVNASTFDIYMTGYTFNKWGTSSSGGTLFDQNDTTITPTMLNSGIANGNVTLKVYAQWTPNTYTIKFFGNTHTGGSTAAMSMTYDVAKNLTANGFTKTGYVFAGWNTSADGTGTSYSDKQSVKNLTATNGATINLYAQWKPITYTIKFDGNGATSGSTASMSMTYDVAKNLTANGFKRTSYNFKGWNTKADGSGTNYTDKQSVKNLTTTNGATITLYAKWEYDPVLVVEQCSVYEGTKSDKTTLFGYTRGNVFDDYVYKTDYPTIGDTIWYNIHFPAEAENFTARQYVRYKGGSWTTRDVTLSSSNTSSQYFPIQFTGDYKKITAGQQYFEIEAKTDWIDSSGNVKKSGSVKTFYIPIKPVVYRTQVIATGYEGTTVAYNGSAGSSGKLYSGQHINVSYKYTADNTWSAVEYLRGAMYKHNGTSWVNVYTSNDGYDAAKNKASISKSSSVTLNSSVGKYTVPVTNQNAVRFKLETWWNSDKTNTLETTWINLPVVQSDVALTSITLINSSTGATLDPNNLKVGTNVKVRYTYKNNTDTKVYVECFKNDKTQISGVYAIPAKSSITVDGYTFNVPNKRNISVWGGVYLEGMGIYNTDYEFNGSNNAMTLTCKVNHPLTLQPITPNADYRENTEVITSYWLKNSYSDDYTPAEDVSIKFCVYKGSNLIYSYTKTKAVVPGSQNNLIYFKWKVPIGFNNADVKITAEIVDDGASYNKVEKSYSTIPYKIVQTPDTQFEKKGPSGFSIPADTYTTGTACEWWEYVYENGEFVQKMYYTGLASGSIKIEPKNTQTATKSGSTWYMNSGYGITMSLSNGTNPSKTGYPDAPANSYTLPQYGIAYFPEYGYSKESGKITTLNLSNGKWIFSATGSYGNVHFTPLWYPDGEYIVRVQLSDMWTPSGMMKKEYKSNRIIIKDSAYDDWYVGR